MTDAFSVAFAPGGDVLISAGTSAAIHVWEAETLQLLAAKEGAHERAIHSLAFLPAGPNSASAHWSPSGVTLVTGSEDRSIKLWSWSRSRAGEEKREL